MGNRWHAGSAAAVAHLDDNIEAYLGMRVETGDHLKRVFAADPDMPIAHILKGYFGKFFSTPKMDAMAAKALESAEACLVQIEGTVQEQHHLNALRLWVAGDMKGAIVQWEAILRAAPHDVMAIKLVQFSQFYLGMGLKCGPHSIASCRPGHPTSEDTDLFADPMDLRLRSPAITGWPRARRGKPLRSIRLMCGALMLAPM